MFIVHTLIIIALIIALISVLDFIIFRHHRLGFKYIPGLKLYNKAIEQTKQGNYTRAIEAFTQALQQNPNLIESYNRRGYARFLAGDIQGAIKDYNEAITLNPSNPQAYINRAYAYNKQGNRTSAIQDYNQATKLYLKQKDSINYRKTLETLKSLQRLDHTDKPVEEKATPETTPSPSPTNNKFEIEHGLYSVKLGDYKGAIQYFTQALKINPQDSTAYYNRGLAHFKLGNNQGALADFNQALLINSTHTEAYISRGNLYLKTGSYQKAIEDYTKSLEFQPNSPHIYYQRALAYSERSEKQRSIKDKIQAQEDYQKAANLFLEIGDSLNYKKAIKHLQKQPSPPASKPAKIQSAFLANSSKSKTKPQNQKQSPSLHLEKKLLTLLNGDRPTALRLIESAQSRNPHKQINWYYEKVIWDLERDRQR